MAIAHFAVETTLLLLAGLIVTPLAGADMHLPREHHSSSTPRLNETVLVQADEEVIRLQPDTHSSTSYNAATMGLADVRDLIRTSMISDKKKASDEYAKALGFSSAKEAGRAELGDPFYIYVTSLYRIKVSKESDPSSLLLNTHTEIYPLLVDQKVKSSLTVTEDQKTHQWRTTEWGSPRLIRMLELQRRKNPGFNAVVLISPQNPLGLRFVSNRSAAFPTLIPIAAIPSLNLKAGIPISALDIFSNLGIIANKYDDSQLEGLKPYTP